MTNGLIPTLQRELRLRTRNILPGRPRSVPTLPSLGEIQMPGRAKRESQRIAIQAPPGDGSTLVQEASAGRASSTALIFKTPPTPERQIKEFRVTLDGVLG